MNLQAMWNEYKELIIVIAGGLFSIVAAVLKSKMKFSSTHVWLIVSVICLAGGGVLWHLQGNVEKYRFDHEKALGVDHLGSLMLLGAAVLGSAGAIWTFINLMRTLFGGSPKEGDERPKKGGSGLVVAGWVVVVLCSIGAYCGLVFQNKMASRAAIAAYEKQWDLALNNALKYPKPALDEGQKPSPPTRRAASALDEANAKRYEELLTRKMDVRISAFSGKWDEAIREFSDEPSIDKFLAEIDPRDADKPQSEQMPLVHES